MGKMGSHDSIAENGQEKRGTLGAQLANHVLQRIM